MVRFRLAFLFVSFVVGGCASGGNTVAPGDMAKVQSGTCQPGSTKSCFCLGGGTGESTCRSDGLSYGTCTGCSGGIDGGITIVDGGGNPCGVCAGCCNGTTCVPYAEQSNTVCGEAGTSCATCGAKLCDGTSGTCVEDNDCTNCTNGCCGTLNNAPHCYVNTSSNCGTGGGDCSTCASGTSCTNGACSGGIDSTHEFLVTVTSAKVYNTESATGSGASNCWDGFDIECGDPDIEVCFAYNAGSGSVQGCTTTINDVPPDNDEDAEDTMTTDTATWSGTDGQLTSGSQAFYIPGSAFTAGSVIITVNDNETFSTDAMGSGTFPAVSSAESSYMAGPFGRVVQVDFTMQ